MSKASRYIQNEILNWIRGEAMPTAPDDVYMALYSNDPTDQNTGTEVSTLVNSTGRVAMTFTNPTTIANGSSIVNNTQVLYTASADGNVTVTHGALFDAQSSGNMLFHWQWSSSVAVTIGDPIVFGPNRITINQTAVWSTYMGYKVFDWVNGTDFTTAPTTAYLAPYSNDPGLLNTGTEITTLVFGTADRVPIAFDAPTDETTRSFIANSTGLSPGDSENNVSISHIGIFDAITGGNLLARLPLDSIVSLITNEPFLVGTRKIAIGIA